MGPVGRGSSDLSERLDSFFEAHWKELRRRKIFSSLRRFIKEHEIGKAVDQLESGAAFEAWNVRRFFRRQALLPVRILAMPSLAYARFWALPQPVGGVLFKYEDGMFRPYDTETQKCGPTYNLAEALNAMSGIAADKGLNQYNAGALVLANVHLPDRFIRFRFLRPEFSRMACVRLRVEYKTVSGVPNGVDSRGLLAAILGQTAKTGLRAEWTSYRITEQTGQTEAGEFDALLKATSSLSLKWLADPNSLPGLEKVIEQAIRDGWPPAKDDHIRVKLTLWTANNQAV